MKKRVVLALPLSLALLALGCGKAGPKNAESNELLLKEVDDTFSQMADSVAKAPDLPALQEAVRQGGEHLNTVFAKLQAIPEDRQGALKEEAGKHFERGNERVNEAIATFHQKLMVGPNPNVILETSKGPIRVELYEKLAPVTVKNFLRYVDEKHYDGTIFHRVIPTFMVQGGGFEPGLKEKKNHEPIVNEAGNLLPNHVGTLAMARTSDPNSASAQFFINVQENRFLDRMQAQDHVGYAVFGKVVDGMDVVNKIKDVPTKDAGGHQNVPVEDVLIKSARRVETK